MLLCVLDFLIPGRRAQTLGISSVSSSIAKRSCVRTESLLLIVIKCSILHYKCFRLFLCIKAGIILQQLNIASVKADMVKTSNSSKVFLTRIGWGFFGVHLLCL